MSLGHPAAVHVLWPTNNMSQYVPMDSYQILFGKTLVFFTRIFRLDANSETQLRGSITPTDVCCSRIRGSFSG
jgi:hypothetical protein